MIQLFYLLLIFLVTSDANVLGDVESCDLKQLDVLRPHPTSCHSFQECDGVEWVTLDCPLNLLFNPTIKQCDYPENVDCKNKAFLKHSIKDDNGEICDLKKLDKLLPHPISCHKFLECDGVEWVTFDCPLNLLFNPTTKQCDYSENVDCKNKTVPNRMKDDQPNEPCDEADLDKLRPDREYCSRFQECSSLGWVTFECAANLWFNAEINKCDYPENVDCKAKTKNSTKDDSCSLEEIDHLRPSNKSCHLFQECNGVNWITLECPEHLWFNPKINACDWPENVDCKSNVGPLQCVINKLYPDYNNCSQYFACDADGRSLIVMPCPSGLHFNPETSRCDYPKNVKCATPYLKEDILDQDTTQHKKISFRKKNIDKVATKLYI